MSKIYPRIPYGHNAGYEQPCRMIVYDTESVQTHSPRGRGRTIHTLRLGCAKLLRRRGDDWSVARGCDFRSPAEWWEFVRSCLHRREPLWVYAHNQSFDFTLCDGWTELESGRIKVEHQGSPYTNKIDGKTYIPRPKKGRLIIDGLPFIVDGWMNGCRVKFVDLLNYCRAPLREIAVWAGMRKWVMPNDDAHEADWISYCQQDVDILQAAVLKLMELWRGRQLGTWQATIASLAFSSFKHLVPDNGIVAHGSEPWPKGNLRPYDKWGTGHVLSTEEVSAVERRAYFGGRIYLGFVGTVSPNHSRVPISRTDRSSYDTAIEYGPLTVVDVNGLYPYVMKHFRYPVELLCTVRHPGNELALTLTRDFECLADVTVNTSSFQYPYRQDGRVLYPTGRYSTSLAGVELRNALSRGHITAIENLCVYYVGRPFGSFVDYWWELRRQAKLAGDSITAKLAKGIANALFGKLGQREPLWRDVRGIAPVIPWGGFIATDPETETVKRYRSIARNVQEMTGRGDCRHTFTAAAACVTAHARNYMDQLRQSCPNNSVIYQDTDSLFVLPTGLQALQDQHYLHETDLGRLKTEGTYDQATIVAPKCYQLDGKLVASGLKSSSFPLDCTTYEMTQFQRSGAVITHNPQGVIESWKSLWRMPGQANQVSVGPDGWTTPLVIT